MSRTTDKRYGSPRWRRLTREIQRRDLYTCHWCGGPAYVTDHVQRSDQPPEFWDPGNLVAACRSCNQGRRQNGDAWQPPNRRTTFGSAPAIRQGSVQPIIASPAPALMGFAYHVHRWGPRDWQTMLVGYHRPTCRRSTTARRTAPNRAGNER